MTNLTGKTDEFLNTERDNLKQLLMDIEQKGKILGDKTCVEIKEIIRRKVLEIENKLIKRGLKK